MNKHEYDNTNVIATWHEIYRFADSEARIAISDCEDAITQNSAAIISLGGRLPDSVVGDVNLTSTGLEKKVNGEWQTVPYPSSIENTGLVDNISYSQALNQISVTKVGTGTPSVFQLPNDVNDVTYDSTANTLTFKFSGGKADKVITLPSASSIVAQAQVVDDVSKTGDNLVISYTGDKADKTISLGIPTPTPSGGKVDSVTYTSTDNTVTVTNADSTSNTFKVESGGRVDSISYVSAYNRLNVVTKPYTGSATSTSYVSLPNAVEDLTYNSTTSTLTVDYLGTKANKTIALGGGSGSVTTQTFTSTQSSTNPSLAWGLLFNYSDCSIMVGTVHCFASPSLSTQTITIPNLNLTHTTVHIPLSPKDVLDTPLYDYTHKFGGNFRLRFDSASSTNVTLKGLYDTQYSSTQTQGTGTYSFIICFK